MLKIYVPIKQVHLIIFALACLNTCMQSKTPMILVQLMNISLNAIVKKTNSDLS